MNTTSSVAEWPLSSCYEQLDWLDGWMLFIRNITAINPQNNLPCRCCEGALFTYHQDWELLPWWGIHSLLLLLFFLNFAFMLVFFFVVAMRRVQCRIIFFARNELMEYKRALQRLNWSNNESELGCWTNWNGCFHLSCGIKWRRD